MDTTPEYIEMCAEAEEIQQLDVEDSFYALPMITPPEIVLYHLDADEGRWIYGGYWEDKNKKGAIWLPRQDQLADIANMWWLKKGTWGRPLIEGLYKFAMSFNPQPFCESEIAIKSFEQLWLAAVMDWKYGKRWNSEKKEWRQK